MVTTERYVILRGICTSDISCVHNYVELCDSTEIKSYKLKKKASSADRLIGKPTMFVSV